MRPFQVATVFVVMLGSVTLEAQENPQTRILAQPASPIEIIDYKAEYQERSQYRREGIRHEIRYRNLAERPVRAISFGLLSFNIFNDFLDRTAGIDMETLNSNKESRGVWVATALSDFAFFTGVAYVNKVRFVDGEIWEADLEQIATQVREIEADFDAARLTTEENQNGNP